MQKLHALFLFTVLATPLLRAEPAEWSQVPGILARILTPVFPARDFVITNYGAVADDQTDCTAAIGKAIDACVKAGGGHVVIPAGEFLTGPIHLQSDVDLHLDKYATIIFSTNSSAYLPAVFSRFESIECYNYSPFIGLYKPVVRNVAMENITVAHTPRVLNVRGFSGAEISNVRIYNSIFKEIEKPDVVQDADVKLVNCSLQPAK